MSTEPGAVSPGGLTIAGVFHPAFVYGTAWKEDRTEGLVRAALEAGFRGIDTANQRKHYHEAGVGAALRAAFSEGLRTRDELFLQTKFTFVDGQDHRLPYDPAAPVAEQVAQSFQSSLEHLGVDYLDSYVLHGPRTRHGLTADDREAWAAMEALQAAGKVGLLGVSNVTAPQLEALLEAATRPPQLVQNRCFAALGWDHQVRRLCRRHGLGYQGFSLLTANRAELARPVVQQLAARYQRTVPQLVFRFALQVGMLCLTGTTNVEHMAQDLAGVDFELTEEDVELLEGIGRSG